MKIITNLIKLISLLVIPLLGCTIYQGELNAQHASARSPEAPTQMAATQTLPQYQPSNIPAEITSEANSDRETTTAPTSTPVYLPLISATETSVPTHDPVEFYVAPNGKPNGDGSIYSPWDLQTALDHPAVVRPGDTIYLRAGKYGTGGNTEYKSRLVGSPGNYITVRPYPEENAVIDGGFWIGVLPCENCKPTGEWVIFRDLEVMNSDPKRQTSIVGSHPEDISRVGGFLVLAPNSKLINNIVHDTRQAFSVWSEALNTELYGNLAYNNGWVGPDRGHGYGIYAQNDTGMMDYEDNIIFNNFGEYAIHLYTQASSIKNFYLEGNIIFNNDFLVGGDQPAEGIAFIKNYVYNGKSKFGSNTQGNQDLSIQENVFCASEFSIDIKWWLDLSVMDNMICDSTAYAVSLSLPGGQGDYHWDENSYFSTNTDNAFAIDEAPKSWDGWRSVTGFDRFSTFTTSQPTGTNIFVRPNVHEAKRAHIIIYNWELKDTVFVDISNTGLEVGDEYLLRNAHNPLDEFISGTYDGGSIAVPMTGWTIAVPIGWGEPLSSNTYPRFGVFILEGAN